MIFEDLKQYNECEIASAGPRYTPAQDNGAPNIEILEVSSVLDALSLSTGFRQHVQSLRHEYSKDIKELSAEVSRIFKKGKETPQSLGIFLDELSRSSPAEVKRHLGGIDGVIKVISSAIEKRSDEVDEIRRQEEQLPKTGIRPSAGYRRELNEFRYSVDKVIHGISKIREYSLNNCLLLTGEWGTGKTHTLCDYTKKLIEKDHHCLFVIAQNLPLGADPLRSICAKRQLASSMSELISKLDSFGKQEGRRSLLIIDGINEGDREAWKCAVDTLYKQIHEVDHIGLVLSCRSPFQTLIFKEELLNSYSSLDHPGFNEMTFEAQEAFFDYYEIPAPEVPLLDEEFSRPLTLKLVCGALKNLSSESKKAKFSDIASGQKGMTYVLETYINELGKPIEEKFELEGKACWNLLKGTSQTKNNKQDGIAVKMAAAQKEVLRKEEIIRIILNVTGWECEEKAGSFLEEVVHSGILFEDCIWNEDNHSYVTVIKLPYQKFSDHIIARHLLEKYLDTSSKEGIRRSFYANRPLGKIFVLDEMEFGYRMPNWAEALMIEFPERVRKVSDLRDNRELVFYLPKKSRLLGPLNEPFLNGLSWRSKTSFCAGTELVIDKLSELDDCTRREVLNILLSLSIKEGHPYSAERLDGWLSGMRMSERDLLWSEFLRKRCDRRSSIDRIIKWSETIDGNKIDRDVVKKCLTVLLWSLTSVNQQQRDRATKAIITLGFLFPGTLFELALYSLKVNDPYVSERMLAASYGVAMNKWAEKEKSFEDSLLTFVQRLTEMMFLPKARYGTHNTVSRDSALGCIEIARMMDKDCIPSQYLSCLDLLSFRDTESPFRHAEEISENEVEAVKLATHMDFENYTIGRLVSDRACHDSTYPDKETILKQIRGRIYDLGYRYEEFEEIDKKIQRSQGPDKDHRVDRYGKKYSWIAYYEMYGLLEARGRLDSYGAGRISCISFDPSMPIPPEEREVKLPNVFDVEFKGYLEWIRNGGTPDYRTICLRKEKGDWILLDGQITHQNSSDERMLYSYLRGYLIENGKVAGFKERYRSAQCLGNVMPEIWEDVYTFAGEIPWSRKHGFFELRGEDGQALPNTQSVLEEAGCGEAPGIQVEATVHRYGWEPYHSIVNDYTDFFVPAPAISNFLGLSFRNQSVELFDKDGEKATIFIDLDKDGTTRLFYLRKDLLEEYMAHTGRTMILAIWGERTMSNPMKYDSDPEVQQLYREGLHVHRTLHQYEEIASKHPS